MRIYEKVGLAVSEVLLPAKNVDLTKWAVVACDQFTSEPEYWKQVESIVGDAPSTLHLVFPEVYLGQEGEKERIQAIHRAMNEYLDKGLFEPFEGMVYVERRIEGRVRKGLVVCVDLERYDYNKGSSSLIRATEGTIVERLPPRIAIREKAPLELPHIMVLIDDPDDTVIGPVSAASSHLPKRYDFETMMNGGHLTGWLVDDLKLERQVVDSLESLIEPRAFSSRYGLEASTAPLLYAMVDGNHSLATAKAIWERIKEQAEDREQVMSSPARYALVELVNLHDSSLVFEPIHRVVFGAGTAPEELVEQMSQSFGDRWHWEQVDQFDELVRLVRQGGTDEHRFGVVRESGFALVRISSPSSNIAVGTLQGFLDEYLKDHSELKLDYVHGSEALLKLGSKPGNLGLFLPTLHKNELFTTVMKDGALPRKTFSMGEANEKRYYMEARRISA